MHFTGPACPSKIDKQEYDSPNHLQILTVLSAEPLHTISDIVAKHNMGSVCPLSVPTATMLLLSSTFIQTTIDRSLAPEYIISSSLLSATALTPELCFSRMATKIPSI